MNRAPQILQTMTWYAIVNEMDCLTTKTQALQAWFVVLYQVFAQISEMSRYSKFLPSYLFAFYVLQK